MWGRISTTISWSLLAAVIGMQVWPWIRPRPSYEDFCAQDHWRMPGGTRFDDFGPRERRAFLDIRAAELAPAPEPVDDDASRLRAKKNARLGYDYTLIDISGPELVFEEIEAFLLRFDDLLGDAAIEEGAAAMVDGRTTRADDLLRRIQRSETPEVCIAAAASLRGALAREDVRWEDARTHYRTAVTHDLVKPDYATDLAATHRLFDDREAEERALRDALARAETYGDQRTLAYALEGLARHQASRGFFVNSDDRSERQAEATVLARRAFDLRVAELADRSRLRGLLGNRITLFDTQTQMTLQVMRMAGRSDLADAILEEAIDAARTHLGAEHEDTRKLMALRFRRLEPPPTPDVERR